jgi:ABC-type transporter Mla MlaB component
MFRITSHIRDDELVLKLEGCLADAWVQELDTCWRDATQGLKSPRVRVDLTGVWQVDDAGRALMTRMYLAGAQFVTRGCVMPELVRDIARSCSGGPASW